MSRQGRVVSDQETDNDDIFKLEIPFTNFE